ncbi:MAG: hypothetical protein JWM57_3689 [Phycisphaerales bacterium]|nr:hypothetical protein [Phycisphaerales bacterium]
MGICRPLVAALSGMVLFGCAAKPSAPDVSCRFNQSHEPWLSRDDTDVSPNGRVKFHGPFGNNAVIAQWTGLPEHEFVRIDVDLLILRSWDGSVAFEFAKVKKDGPDYFRLGVVNGPTLVSTTFSCQPDDPPGFNDYGKFQNYPSFVPGDRLRPWTGAAEKNTLGYHYPKLGPPFLVPMDATYRLRLLVPHHGETLAVQMEALGLQNLLDENWGFRDIRVVPMRSVPAVDDAAIAAAFKIACNFDLSENDRSAHPDETINTLVMGMDKTVAWIAQNVQPRGLSSKAVEAAIRDAGGDDDHIRERDAAIEILAGFGPAVEPWLRDAKKRAPGEQRERFEQVLGRLGTITITDDGLRRVALATRVLEIIGTPEALQVRHHLVAAE